MRAEMFIVAGRIAWFLVGIIEGIFGFALLVAACDMVKAAIIGPK